MRSIQQRLGELHDAGIHPVAISVDPPEVSQKMKTEAGYTFTFLSDPTGEVIRRYDLTHAGAGDGGKDISRPAEFLVDTSGIVRWVNLTENLAVRARPEQMLDAVKTLP